jgi:hypothetical protein
MAQLPPFPLPRYARLACYSVVPPMRDMNADPLGNLLDWRDFLAAVRTVN